MGEVGAAVSFERVTKVNSIPSMVCEVVWSLSGVLITLSLGALGLRLRWNRWK